MSSLYQLFFDHWVKQSNSCGFIFYYEKQMRTYNHVKKRVFTVLWNTTLFTLTSSVKIVNQVLLIKCIWLIDHHFAKLQKTPQDFCNNVLWTDEIKVKIKTKRNKPTVKHGSGGVRSWAYFIPQAPCSLWVNHKILCIPEESNVRRPSIQQLKLGWNWIM